MTLGRTSSGAIKIKTDTDGGGLRAVGCACCGEPLGCCAYTASGILNGLYSAADLPDTLKVYNGGFSMNGNVFEKVGSGYHLDMGDGYQIEAQLIAGNYEWRLFPVGQEDESTELNTEIPQCLLGIRPPEGECAEDMFADSYLIQSPNFGTETVIRGAQACFWVYEYEEPCIGSFAQLVLGSDGNNAPYWYCEINKTSCGGYFEFGIKDGPKNSPVGSYFDNFGDLVFTVS